MMNAATMNPATMNAERRDDEHKMTKQRRGSDG
jgi:hypothetical protein